MDGGGEVDVSDELPRGGRRRKPRAAHDQRHAAGRVMREELAARDAVLSLQVAVVRRKDDVRVLQRTGPLEGADDVGHALVHGQERLLTVW
jgi:hypothetical protein